MANTISFSANARRHNQARKYIIFALTALIMVFILVLIITRDLKFLIPVIVLPIIVFLIIIFSEEKKLNAGAMFAQARNKSLDAVARVAQLVSHNVANSIAEQKSLPTARNMGRKVRSGAQGMASRAKALAGIDTQSSWFYR